MQKDEKKDNGSKASRFGKWPTLVVDGVGDIFFILRQEALKIYIQHVSGDEKIVKKRDDP